MDYTYIKYVKKQNKAKPGMVIYTNNKTVIVHWFINTIKIYIIFGLKCIILKFTITLSNNYLENKMNTYTSNKNCWPQYEFSNFCCVP